MVALNFFAIMYFTNINLEQVILESYSITRKIHTYQIYNTIVA